MDETCTSNSRLITPKPRKKTKNLANKFGALRAICIKKTAKEGYKKIKYSVRKKYSLMGQNTGRVV
jgi:hypothetical protein